MQNLAEFDSAVKKTRFRVDFFVNLSIYSSIYLSRVSSGCRLHLGTILTRNGLNDVFSQPLVPFRDFDDTL